MSSFHPSQDDSEQNRAGRHAGPHRLFQRARIMLHRSSLLQILLLSGFWAVGECVVQLAHLPIPGGVMGMVVVLVLLATGWIRPRAVRRGAYWLLAEMLLFFVPAVMAVIDHGEFIGLLGLKIVGVILVGTILVMGSTALTVELCLRLSMKREGERHADA